MTADINAKTPTEKENETRWRDFEKTFSKSKIWELQTGYYQNKGVDAWHSGQVPHYISTNITLARQCAGLALETLYDWLAERPTSENARPEPLTILELGAGHGRFSHHFLKALEELADAPLEELPFEYVQSDLVEANIQFWLDHPQLKDWREKGVLKAVKLDVAAPLTEFVDYQSGLRKSLAGRRAPLVVVANYMFDSLPADLYYLSEGRVFKGLLSLECEKDGEPVMEDLYETLHPRWSFAPLEDGESLDPRIVPLLQEYADFSDVYATMPVSAINFVDQLSRMSIFPSLLLIGDKGPRELGEAVMGGPPHIANHGSISISVNFHALIAYAAGLGATVLKPDHAPAGFAHFGLLFNGGDRSWRGLRLRYRLHNARFGGDEFFVLKKCMERRAADLSVNEILSWLRQSYYDANIFALTADRLADLVDRPRYFQNRDIEAAMGKVWDAYYRLGSGADVAGRIAYVLFKLCLYEKALSYLSLAEEDYGPNAPNAYLEMICYFRLKQLDGAQKACDKTWSIDPDFMDVARYRRRLGIL